MNGNNAKRMRRRVSSYKMFTYRGKGWKAIYSGRRERRDHKVMLNGFGVEIRKRRE